MDLSTNYLGLQLKNPVVPSASPLSRNLGTARALEDAGASALVMYSLFEEELQDQQTRQRAFLADQELGHSEADSYLPVHAEPGDELDNYLEQIRKLKENLSIPVIASLNGISNSGWVENGKLLAEAGADALELNVYYVAADMRLSAEVMEQRYLALLSELRGAVDIPVTVKLSPFFSSLANFVKDLETAGANGVSLFNRFYQPDIDIDSLRVAPPFTCPENTTHCLPCAGWASCTVEPVSPWQPPGVFTMPTMRSRCYSREPISPTSAAPCCGTDQNNSRVSSRGSRRGLTRVPTTPSNRSRGCYPINR